MAAKKKKIAKETVVDAPVFVLVDKQDRNKLGEGRTNGMGFALAKRNGNEIELVQPVSPCKDYLNDVIYSEATGKPFLAYGLATEKRGIFEGGNAYLVMSILNTKHSSTPYPFMERDIAALENNFQNQQLLINWFEEKFGVAERTKIIKLQNNKFLAICPLFWTDATYKISLLSLLLRNAIFYKGGDPMEFLRNTKEDAQDVYSIKGALDKIALMLGGFIPKQDLSTLKSVHNTGICGFKFEKSC